MKEKGEDTLEACEGGQSGKKSKMRKFSAKGCLQEFSCTTFESVEDVWLLEAKTRFDHVKEIGESLWRDLTVLTVAGSFSRNEIYPNVARRMALRR